MEIRLSIPKSVLTALNQLYDLEQKLKKHGDPNNFQRNVTKMKDAFAEEGLPMADAGGGVHRVGLTYEDPMGQSFKETRTDLDATISGTGTNNLVVVEVIKPIIRALFRDGAGEYAKIVQKGIVIVESQKDSTP
jgi:hypothetical protein